MVTIGADFDLYKQGREAISEAMRKEYEGPKGSRLRHIDSINGEKAAGWSKMKKGEERILHHRGGTIVRLKRIA